MYLKDGEFKVDVVGSSDLVSQGFELPFRYVGCVVFKGSSQSREE